MAGLQAKRDLLSAIAPLDVERAVLGRSSYAVNLVAFRTRMRCDKESREREGRNRCNQVERPRGP